MLATTSGELGVVLLKLRINHVQLNGERGEDHHQRDKDDQADNTDGQQRGKPVAIPSAVRSLFYGLKMTVRMAAHSIAEK